MPNSILHSCCFPGPKRCQCKPFVASVIHPPLSHAPRETHREWWENYLTFWSSAGFFRGKKNDCGVFGFVAICPEQRSVLSRQYSRKNITFMTLLEWNFTVPKPWKPPNFSEVLISSEVKEVQFFLLQLLMLESTEAYVELPEESCFVSDNYRIHPACKESSQAFELWGEIVPRTPE